MELPAYLSDLIQKEVDKFSLKTLTITSHELSERYAKGFVHERFESDRERAAYLIARLPATFAVCARVFAELKEKSHRSIRSLIDLGSGPGTVLFACLHFFPELQTVTLIEQDPFFIRFCKEAFLKSGSQAKLEIISADMRQVELKEADLITCSYSLNELNGEGISHVADKILTKKGLAVFIEPGTPRGYEVILTVRDKAIAKGRHPLAPCPHSFKCPLEGTKRWCHFSERLQRSEFHRMLKQGHLSYEDEKYSYFIASETPISSDDRIIGYPRKHAGHISFDLCTQEGTAIQRIVSKKEGDLYKLAKKLSWGDTFPS